MSCQRVLPDVLLPGEVVQACHHLHLDPEPREVGVARRFVREHAPPLPPDITETLVLLTSELVTNAVLHARTAIDLGLAIAEHSLLVTVHDEDLARPEQQPYDGREGGWGLGLVSALAARAALEVHPGEGKTAWFLLRRDEAVGGVTGSAVRKQDETGKAGG